MGQKGNEEEMNVYNWEFHPNKQICIICLTVISIRAI